MYCERCGLKFQPKQSVCTRCGAVATRHWLQLIALCTLVLAVVCNVLLELLVLPRFAGQSPHRFFSIWLWLDYKIALHGWVPLALGLLAWDLLVWQARPKIKAWVTRKLLTFTLVASATPFIPTWVPAGQPPDSFFAKINIHPGLPAALAWGAVVFVVILLCVNSETRDSLLGHGRILSLVSIGLLAIVFVLTLIGWRLS